MNSSRNIFRKDIVFYLIISLLIIVTSFIVARYSYRTTHADQLERLFARAETISLLLNTDELDRLDARESDMSLPEYSDLKLRLMKVRENYPDTRFIYLVKEREGKIYFMADSEREDSRDSSPAGQEYTEAPKALMEVFESKQSRLDNYTDRWGAWISAFVPVVNKDGKLVSVVGIDIDAEDHIKTLAIRLGLIVLATFTLLFIVTIFYYYRKKEESVITLKSEFIALASHELRSPLTVMRWQLSTLLKKDDIPPILREQLEEINRATIRLVSMTGSILETTAAEHQLEKKQITARANIAVVLNNSKISVLDAAKQKNIDIRISEKARLTALVKGETEKLELVFTNIFNNAIKYSPTQSTVEVDIIPLKQALKITVADHGIGIPTAEIKHIFDGFYRAKNAKGAGVRGSGFGLYMTKKIVEFYDGSISCSSEPGSGTVFSIILPI